MKPAHPVYLVIQVEVSAAAQQTHQHVGKTREARDFHWKDYLETLGLRPRHHGGTMEWWEDPVTHAIHYCQHIPLAENDPS